MIWVGAVIFTLIFIVIFGLILSPPTKLVKKLSGDDDSK